MKYFNAPPKIEYESLENVPQFVKKWYSPKKPVINLEFILDLFSWAEQEYADTLAYYTARGDEKTYRMLMNVNSLRVLAFSDELKQVIKYFTFDPEKTPAREVERLVNEWNSIPYQVRESMIRARDIYRGGASIG